MDCIKVLHLETKLEKLKALKRCEHLHQYKALRKDHIQEAIER